MKIWAGPTLSPASLHARQPCPLSTSSPAPLDRHAATSTEVVAHERVKSHLCNLRVDPLGVMGGALSGLSTLGTVE